MKNVIIKTGAILGITASMLFSACDDYLGTIPKGEKIPETFRDYNAFIAYGDNHFHDNIQQMALLNDLFCATSRLNSYELLRINYMWDEQADRKVQDNHMMISSGTATYTYAYQGIVHWNLIIEDAGKLKECTQQQRDQLKAQAKVLRAIHYFHLANYYAKQYTQETAGSELSVPLAESGNIQSPSPQVSIERMYEFMIGDLTEEAISQLPAQGETFLHPTKGAGYGMLARIYLQMKDYDKALANAEKALAVNGTLYNWVAYYQAHRESYEKLDYSTAYPAVTLTNPENYVYCLTSNNYKSTAADIPVERSKEFEPGDTRFLTRWQFKAMDAGDRYQSIRSDYVNGAGISTVEMYHIKAECLARKEKVNDAMDVLNAIRITRILPEYYQPLSATTKAEAVKLIIRDKANEFIQTSIPFWDMRRLNTEAEYARSLTKTVDGVAYTLRPDSHLWTLPFSEQIMTNPGNNPIQQNTPR